MIVRYVRKTSKLRVRGITRHPAWRESPGSRWIPHTNGQQRRKCFHLMTSSWNMCASTCLMWLLAGMFFKCIHAHNLFNRRLNVFAILMAARHVFRDSCNRRSHVKYSCNQWINSIMLRVMSAVCTCQLNSVSIPCTLKWTCGPRRLANMNYRIGLAYAIYDGMI